MTSIARQAPDGKRRTLSLRTHLHILIVAAVLPLMAAGLLTMWIAAERLRLDSSERLIETATTMAHAVDRSLIDNISTIALLHDTSTLVGLEEASTRWRQAKASGSETRMISSLDPVASRLLPAGLMENAISSGAPQISDLFFAERDNKTPLVAIAVPDAKGGGGKASATALVLRSNHLIDAISTSPASQSLLVAVVDRSGRIAARSRSPERFLGQQVPDWASLTSLGTSNGHFEAKTKEGGHIIFAFQLLEAAPGWALVVGEPLQTFQARWQEPLVGIGIGGVIGIIIALLASQQLSRHILMPVRALARRSRAVADGNDSNDDDRQPPSSSITEFVALQESISDAERALHLRAEKAKAMARTLDRSQNLYRTVAGAGALVFWQSDPDANIVSSTGWSELTGQDPDQALGQGWLQSVHPEDLAQIEIAARESVQHRQALDIEFRVRTATGAWRWVRSRGARLEADDNNGWAGVLEDVDARRKAQAHIAYLAQHDPLTGLANRHLLMERLTRVIASKRNGEPAALLCLDLDRFKEINDTLGHPMGDALLCEVASRLNAQVRSHDLVARLGGDEFVVLLTETSTPGQISDLASRLLETLEAPYALDGYQAVVGASIGIAIADDAAITSERLLQNADLALYRVKAEGRGRFRFFEPEMDALMQQRRQLDIDLRQAIVDRQFVLHYQPLVDLKSKRIQGFEALLRWNHPLRGMLAPSDFLPLLEEIGLIRQVGQWTMRQACQEATHWPDPLKLSVNIAPAQLDSTLHKWVLDILSSTQLPAHRLELEITENALIANIEAATASLLQLKLAGVSIVMDDFGTGYSSLGYLRSFPFDKVKIDRSFIQNLGNGHDGNAIIHAVANLCSRLGITTVIEGVETQAQLEQIGSAACDQAQGFLFGEPIDGAELPAMIQRSLQTPSG